MVNVKNEYGRLREVIVGRVDNANMPKHGFDLHAINYADKDKIPSNELGFFDPKVYEESIEDLDLLSKNLERLNRKTFMFVANPLKIKGATGAPINPVAIY